MNATLPKSQDFLALQGPKLVPLLDRFEKAGSLHSTLLFTGPEGVGKKSLVLYFIQTLFCDESLFSAQREDDSPNLFGDLSVSIPKTGRIPCGKCRSCVRTEQAQWMDLLWFDPESSDEERRIGNHSVEVFRALKSKLGLGPAEEPFKVVVIAEAELMTAAAANSILKILEEPPPNWIFILTASDSSRLLPTILSRCMEIRLNPIPSESIFSILRASKGLDFHSVRGQVAARSAHGSLSRALSFMSDEVWQLREQVLGLLSSPAHEWMRLVEALAKSQMQAQQGLDLIESLFSDMLQWQVNGDSHLWTHEDQKDLLMQIAEVRHLSPERLCHILEQTAEKRSLATRPLNAKLFAQEILIPLIEVL